MYLHHTIGRGFILEGEEKTKTGLAAAKARVGEAGWKSGYSPAKCAVLREEFGKAGAEIRDTLAGELVRIEAVTTKDDGGNTYQKAWVHVRDASGVVQILSGDIDAEFTQRLLAKLEGVQPGAKIVIGCMVETVQRGMRSYANHIAFVRDAADAEVKAPVDHFGAAMAEARAKEAALIAADLNDPDLIKASKAKVKVKHFADLLANLAQRFVKPQTAPAA